MKEARRNLFCVGIDFCITRITIIVSKNCCRKIDRQTISMIVRIRLFIFWIITKPSFISYHFWRYYFAGPCYIDQPYCFNIICYFSLLYSFLSQIEFTFLMTCDDVKSSIHCWSIGLHGLEASLEIHVNMFYKVLCDPNSEGADLIVKGKTKLDGLMWLVYEPNIVWSCLNIVVWWWFLCFSIIQHPLSTNTKS